MKYEEFYDLNAAKPVVRKKFKENPKSTVSGMFRVLRKDGYFRYFADYPLMSVIVETVGKMGIKVTRQAVKNACRYSEDLKGLPSVYDMLLKSRQK